jgi:DNA-binding NarL/FixJ family response regulator
VPLDIVIVDDHAMVRSGLRLLLESEGEFSVVAEAGDIETALKRVEAHRPRVILLDVNMPGRPSLPAIPELLAASPGAAVVVMTMQDEPAYARAALSAGASGYVLKEAAEAELLEAVRAAAAGRTYLNPQLGARMIATGDTGAPPHVAAAEPDTPPTGAGMELAIGSTFAGHRIDGEAGRGGMGVVYRATDLTLDRRVALKLIEPGMAGDPVFRARFVSECKLAAAIDHPNVVPIFHAGEERGVLYVTMRYIDGTDLRTLLAEVGRLEARRAVTIIAQVAGALDAAHQRGLVHRDVKPANVLLATRDGAERAFLTDFGVTKERAAQTGLTKTGFAVGTADYMAPEQARGADVDGRADIYALGCVLFRALTGTVVYERDSDVEKMWAHIHDPPPQLLDVCPGLPPALGEVLDRALAKHPDDRQQSAADLAAQALASITW